MFPELTPEQLDTAVAAIRKTRGIQRAEPVCG
jgi:hypothetical protein